MIQRIIFFVCFIMTLTCHGSNNEVEDPSKIPKEWILFSGDAWAKFPIVWMFDCDFPKEFKDDARNGFQYWDDLIDMDLFVESNECGAMEMYPKKKVVLVTFQSTAHIDLKGAQHATLAWAWKHSNKGVITSGRIMYQKVWFDADKSMRLSTARHEVGHILGMNHVAPEKCLLHPFIQYDSNPKKACKREIKEFLKIYEGKNK